MGLTGVGHIDFAQADLDLLFLWRQERERVAIADAYDSTGIF